MALLHDHPQKPPAGDHFTDPTGVILRAKSIEELLTSIVRYRSNNGLPKGNPAREVEDFYRVQYPWLVQGEPEPTAKQDQLDAWLNRIWRNPPHRWVDESKVETRLNGCFGCPEYDAEWRPDPAGLKRLMVLGGGRYHQGAGFCRHHRWACGLAIAVDAPDSTASALDGCWAMSFSSGTPGT